MYFKSFKALANMLSAASTKRGTTPQFDALAANICNIFSDRMKIATERKGLVFADSKWLYINYLNKKTII